VILGETFENLLAGLSYFTEKVYNKQKPHSALGYLPPDAFEESLIIQQNNRAAPRQAILTLSIQS